MNTFFFYKQRAAYEVPACLVGSEMGIRDGLRPLQGEARVLDAPDPPSPPALQEHAPDATPPDLSLIPICRR